VRVQRVLDRQRMQLELSLDLSQLRLVRLVKADPHEMCGLLRPTAPLIDRDVGMGQLIAAAAYSGGQRVVASLLASSAMTSLLVYGALLIPETHHAVEPPERQAGHPNKDTQKPARQPSAREPCLDSRWLSAKGRTRHVDCLGYARCDPVAFVIAFTLAPDCSPRSMRTGHQLCPSSKR
jgi:hypothetical protein